MIVCACLLLCLGARHLFRRDPLPGRSGRADPDRERPLAPAWVVLVPAALYGAWFLWSQNQAGNAGNNIKLSNLLLVPDWALNSLATVGSSLLGLNYPSLGSGWGPVIAVAAVVALGWRLWRGSIPKWLWVAMTVPAALWLIAGAACDAAGSPAPEIRVHVPGHGRRADRRRRGGARAANPAARDDHPLRGRGDRRAHEYRPPPGQLPAISHREHGVPKQPGRRRDRGGSRQPASRQNCRHACRSSRDVDKGNYLRRHAAIRVARVFALLPAQPRARQLGIGSTASSPRPSGCTSSRAPRPALPAGRSRGSPGGR